MDACGMTDCEADTCGRDQSQAVEGQSLVSEHTRDKDLNDRSGSIREV